MRSDAQACLGGGVITSYETGPLGDDFCPACKQPVYYAWDDEMTSVALDPDPAGAIAVSLDGNHLPWCRDATGTQLAFDETLHRLHDPTCAGLATVTAITAARSLRQPPRPERRRRYA
jgi:hypothetical protein